MTQVMKMFLSAIEKVGLEDIYTDAPEVATQIEAMKELSKLAGSAAAGKKLTKKEVRSVLKKAGFQIEKTTDEN